jgi:hypothetical protein
VELVESGERQPVKHLSEIKNISGSAIRTILGEARSRDILTAAPKGRPGGQLTKSGHEILDINYKENT